MAPGRSPSSSRLMARLASVRASRSLAGMGGTRASAVPGAGLTTTGDDATGGATPTAGGIGGPVTAGDGGESAGTDAGGGVDGTDGAG